MSSESELIETTVSKVAAELARRGLDLDDPVTITGLRKRLGQWYRVLGRRVAYFARLRFGKARVEPSS